ncbi:MAG: hypothetical protein JRC68_07090 [Deltaproteobacteria bacterium]|nr:hypothetical protein [Deltaproteobacteria bacterium]
MKKDRRRIWWSLFLLSASGIAILAGYFMGTDKGSEVEEVLVKEKKVPLKVREIRPLKKEILPEKMVAPEKIEIKETKRPIEAEKKDYCGQIGDRLREFFDYLNTKEYIQRLDEGTDSYDHFKRLLNRLSKHLPIPAGEGLSQEIMNNNIFFFFRILGNKDIRLIKEITKNEADTLEMNLELFYNWFMLQDRCPDHEGIRPSLNVLYHYAGFFLNTIGGKVYLLRRSTELRLLVKYYCLLIIHEADKKGKNSYGIDIYPEIAPLVKDIGIYPDLRYKDDYTLQLNGIQDYYAEKR